MHRNDQPPAIVAQAEKLVADIERQLAESEQALRERGLNLDKLRCLLASHAAAAVRAEVQRLVQEDLWAVQHEVDKIQPKQTPGLPKNPRTMV